MVTCGGLCPGLNDVIQNIVFTLEDYGVPPDQIFGIKYGLRGFYDKDFKPINLNKQIVQNIHLQGGTMLVRNLSLLAKPSVSFAWCSHFSQFQSMFLHKTVYSDMCSSVTNTCMCQLTCASYNQLLYVPVDVLQEAPVMTSSNKWYSCCRAPPGVAQI